ncbi:mechanosensitive ion channel family protein [Enterococcus sp. HY326]|uniref:mechanosensitive ion channel family protein n=1 Tax=Enterococcus sp. HY326 TaxID=2971265 RepID=UPI00224072B4|nr:mechanosensitive ion channel family protein [Enterococcus sp. HY326]
MEQLILATATTESSSVDIAQEATQKLNALQRFWNSIDWDQITLTIIEKTLYILFIVVLFLLLAKIGRAVINHLYKGYANKASLSESRLKTIHTLLGNTYSYILVFFFLYSLLSTIGIPVGSLLAGAGIAGVAIGLGAQGFMNDIITGFFIILEKQMDVGNYIKLTNLSIEGTVTNIGIRSIQVKSIDGTLHFIPNRNITTISNLSRSNMLVQVDVRIKQDEDLDQINLIIEKVNQELAKKYHDDIQNGPSIFGLVDLGNGNFAIRTTMYVLNGLQAIIKEDFLTTYVKELTDAGFTIPSTPIVTV